MRLYYGLPQPSPDVASTVSANPAPPSSVKRTTKLNIATWLVAHGTKLRVRSRLGGEVGRGWRGGLGWGTPGNSAAHVSRLILTGVRPSGLRPNTGPNGPGTLVSPSGTDRKLLNGPGSDVNWTSRRPVPSARPVSDTGRSADQVREGHFYRGICDRYVRRSQSVVTHMGYCLRLECERSGVPLRKTQQNGQPIAGRVVVSRWLSALNFLILLTS